MLRILKVFSLKKNKNKKQNLSSSGIGTIFIAWFEETLQVQQMSLTDLLRLPLCLLSVHFLQEMKTAYWLLTHG